MTWKILAGIAAGIVVVVVAVVLLTGDSKADKAMAQVCDSRADIAAQVKTLQGLTPSTAQGKVKPALQAIGADIKDIAGARADLSSERRDQVRNATQQFAAGVKDTLGGVTSLAALQTAGTQIRESAQQLAQAYRSSYAKIDCSSS